MLTSPSGGYSTFALGASQTAEKSEPVAPVATTTENPQEEPLLKISHDQTPLASALKEEINKHESAPETSTSALTPTSAKQRQVSPYCRLLFCAVFPWIPVVKTSGTLSFLVKIVEF